MTSPRIERPGGFVQRIRNVVPAYKFLVEIEGIVVGEFAECGGLSVERRTHEIKEGGVNEFVHRKPGQVAFANITLKRGLTYDRDLLEWCLKGRYDGRVERKHLSIIIQGHDGVELTRLDFYDAYPVNWKLEPLSVASTEVAWESLELTHAQSSGGGGGGGFGGGGGGGAGHSRTDRQAAVDLWALAERVVALMRREAAIERERERGV